MLVEPHWGGDVLSTVDLMVFFCYIIRTIGEREFCERSNDLCLEACNHPKLH